MKAADVFDRLLALEPDALFALYAEMLPNEKDGAAAVARALREAARRGALDDDVDARIALLVFCLVDAPSPAAAFHLAKALAAFGERAAAGAPYVAAWLADLHVVDDETFWIFDGLLYALAYLGGPAARRAIELVAEEAPPRVAKATGVYEGELSAADREARYRDTLREVTAMLDHPPGAWRSARSTLTRTTAPENKANWRLRR